MNRSEWLLSHIDATSLGLEIGPSHNPIAPKADGYNVRIMDHLNRERLIEKYRNHGVDLGRIEEVDYIWDGRSYADVVGREHKFEWIICSHMIEHTPDLVGFLKDCESILIPGGKVLLAVPDKRYCFDHHRPLSGLAAIIDAHENKSRIHSVGTACEYFLSVVKRDGKIAWTPETIGDFELVHGLEDAKRAVNSVRDGKYLDLHAWCFVPHSFRLLIHDLHLLGLINLHEHSFQTTVGHEFLVVLQLGGAMNSVDRLSWMRMIEVELCVGVASGCLEAEVALPRQPIWRRLLG